MNLAEGKSRLLPELGPEPLVSILSTSFNHERWLLDTIRSVRSQSYPRVEHLIVDDGSTDGSLEILRRESWPSLRWTTRANTGQARALNDAYAMSQGEIVGWLSSDDVYYATDVVARAVDCFRAMPSVAMVYGHAVLIADDGRQLQAEWVPPACLFNVPPSPYVVQPATFVRRAALGTYFVDESFDIAMDLDLWLRLSTSHGVARVGMIMAGERHHDNRRSYMRSDAAKRVENQRLRRAVPGAGSSKFAQAYRLAWRIAYRLLGLTLVPRIISSPATFEGYLDSRWSLALRQVAARRRWL